MEFVSEARLAGMPYHYSSEAETIAWKESPACVVDAVDM